MKTNTLYKKPLTYVVLALIVSSLSCAPLHNSKYAVTQSNDDTQEDEWSQFFAGASAGYGSTSVEGESTSSFCAGAELMYNFLENENGALYGGLFANYHSSSSDFLDESLFRGGVRARYFDHVIASQRLQAIYGVDASVLSGKREFSTSEDDVSGTALSAVVGLNWDFPQNNFSVGFEAPVFNYWNQTFEFDGGETDVSTTSFGINKNNIVMAYLRFGF